MECVIVCVSSEVSAPERIVNTVPGLVTVVMPPTRLYRICRRLFGDADAGASGAAPFRTLGGLAPYCAMDRRLLAATLATERCTDILCQEYEYARFAIVASVARSTGRGLYASFQGGTPATNFADRMLRRRAIRQADGLIVGSLVELARVRRDYGVAPQRLAFIPNPVSIEMWHPVPRGQARAELGLPLDSRIAICHCRIDYRRKGIDVLLEAWRRVTSSATKLDLRLHIIGSGPDSAQLRAVLERDPVPGLRWVDKYIGDRAQMRRELSAADVYVLASRHEGFPVATLEAMACGLPVVMTDVPGAREILPDGETSGGVIVPISEPAALASAVSRLLGNDERRQAVGAAAHARVTEFASSEAVGKQLAAFLSVTTICQSYCLKSIEQPGAAFNECRRRSIIGRTAALRHGLLGSQQQFRPPEYKPRVALLGQAVACGKNVRTQRRVLGDECIALARCQQFQLPGDLVAALPESVVVLERHCNHRSFCSGLRGNIHREVGPPSSCRGQHIL